MRINNLMMRKKIRKLRNRALMQVKMMRKHFLSETTASRQRLQFFRKIKKRTEKMGEQVDKSAMWYLSLQHLRSCNILLHMLLTHILTVRP